MTSKTINISTLNILAILLIEGFITISVEIISIRQLLPFVGSSVVVTSLIIGFFLLFLAIGYYIGGQRTKTPLEILRSNFNIVTALVGIGLSYLFCQLFFYTFDLKLKTDLLFNLSVYLLIIIAPITTLLGQTIPIATNFFKKSDPVNLISSKALFISTLGSFLGAILTSLLLLNFFGVAMAVFVNALLLQALSLYLAIKTQKYKFIQIVISLFLVFFIFNLNISLENSLFNLSNQYGNYRILSTKNNSNVKRIFIANEAAMSSIDSQNKGADYIEYIKRFLFNALNLQYKKILVVGAGGFSISHQKTNQNEFTYVDIDKSVKQLAEMHFLKAPIKGKFIAEDARTFFNKNNSLYDVIISDNYQAKDIPSSLVSVEYFEQLKKHIKEDGYAIFNLIISPFYHDSYSQRLDNTINQVFKHCIKHPLNFHKIANVIYICKLTANIDGIYTDNFNRATFDQFRSTH